MLACLLIVVFQLQIAQSGPQPKITASFSSEKAEDASIVMALRDRETFTMGDYYQYNKVDLNGDRVPEVLVYVTGRWVCGSGGCPLFVLKRQDTNSYIVVSEISLGQVPIVVSSRRTNGWNDLLLWQRGYAWDPIHKIGQPSYYARLPFDGHSYPENPTIEPAKPLTELVSGVAYIANPEKGEFGIRIPPRKRSPQR